MIGYLLKKANSICKDCAITPPKEAPHNRHKTINCTRKRVSSYEMIFGVRYFLGLLV